MSWLFNRLREPSSMAGGGLIAYGVNQLFGTGVEQADQIGAVLQDAVPQLLTGNWIGGAVSLAFGVGALFLSEKGEGAHPAPRIDPRYHDPLDPRGHGGRGLY